MLRQKDSYKLISLIIRVEKLTDNSIFEFVMREKKSIFFWKSISIEVPGEDRFQFERVSSISDRVCDRDKEVSLSSISGIVGVQVTCTSEKNIKTTGKFVVKVVMNKKEIFQGHKVPEF